MRTKLDTKPSLLGVGVPAMAVISGSFLSDTNVNAEQLLRQWMRLYHYGHMYMPALCVATFGLYGYVSLSRRALSHERRYQYVVAATSTISMVPFTWLVMSRTNDTLFLIGAPNAGTGLNL
ncbi:hypothetical protein ACLOAV_010294 [Pseudogymnoascus australis]